MSEKFRVLENQTDINRILSTYFDFINGKYLIKALKCFVNKKGYGQEIVFVSFKNDLDDYDMAELPKTLDDEHVLVELGFPAVEVEELAYLDFKTFYNYLEENVTKVIKKNPEQNELVELLENVRISLGV
ncbi:hypothetical protein [Vagococcus silagei]|uniref:Uncharacterized protein n=1 Tax=Vagococcus silagei TaxID=2508885 RepID=A0A4S3B7M1_9ENTE|nr:hypothetical protein [Vagococcus silagei]THB62080.1 hypothetical protein ESZ54_02420 [Vagococcus silagei]